MLLNSFLLKLALPVSVIVFTSFTFLEAPINKELAGIPASDSTLSVPIEVLNKDQRPTVTVEKEVAIPQGYTYLRHSLSLVSAFPMEGVEQSGDWIAGPGQSWSVFAKLALDSKRPERIVVRASASPGRQNAEIGAQAVLTVELRKQARAN